MTLQQGIDRIAEMTAANEGEYPHLDALWRAGATDSFYAGCAEVARSIFEIDEDEYSIETDPDWQNNYARDNK